MPAPRSHSRAGTPEVALGRGPQVFVRRPAARDAKHVVAAIVASRGLHGRWVQAPTTHARYRAYLRRFASGTSVSRATHVGLLVCRRDDAAPVGVFNLSEIVYGAFRSAYLGYYALAPYAGHGYMSEGMSLVLRYAFRNLRLHRIEVNVQPGNVRSIALVRRAGFSREGFSRRYVKIAGRWRDHERWALLIEDWRAQRSRGA
jgi:ribosomal-protein-alanine N-acetyltransferase